MANQDKLFNFEKDFIDDETVFDICNDNYILIVGSESVLEGKDDEADINKYIRKGVGISSFNQIKGDENKQKEVFSFFQETDLGEIETKLKQINHNDSKGLKYSQDLENLLQTRLFKMVFTTTISRSLENLMEKVWKEGNYDVRVYWPNKDKDFWNQLKKATKPTLVYLFGRADDIKNPENRFVCNDDAAFPFMRALMFDMFLSNEAPMRKFLKDKKILSLGCQFDDWYSRFFWYIMTNGLVEKNTETVYVLDETTKTPQKKLSLFFKRNGLTNYSVSIPEFSKGLETFFNERESPITQWIKKPTQDNSGIFLSYLGEKRSDVRKLYFKLKKEEFDVCLSDKEIPNEGYLANISNTYNNKDLFVIVLTPEIKEMLEDDNYSEIIIERQKKEYKKILEQNKPILLLAVNGYSFSSAYHEKLNFFGPRSGIDLMANGGWGQFISFLKWAKTKKKRKHHEVFISYFNANSVEAHLLFESLKNLNPWLDYYYLAGVENWDENIRGAIKKSKVFVSLLTPEVRQHIEILKDEKKTETEKEKARRYYQKEIEWAMEENIPIILYSRNGYDFAEKYHDYLVNDIKLGSEIRGIGKQNDNRVNGFGKNDTKNLEKKVTEIINKEL